MKKCISILALFFGAAAAADGSEGAKQYEGPYVGVGLSYQRTQNEVKGWDNADTSIGGTPMRGFKLYDSGTDQVGIALSGGYGKIFNECGYIGISVNLDISSDKKKTQGVVHSDFNGDVLSTTCKPNAIIPTIIVNLGGVIHDTLLNINLGAALVGQKIESEAIDLYVSDQYTINRGGNKVIPVAGFAFRKNVNNTVGVFGDFDYRFAKTKKENFEKRPYNSRIENEQKSYVIRLGITKSF